MPEIILTLLLKVLPYIAGLIAIVSGYFFIKHKGVVQEREKQQVVKAKEVAKAQAEVQKAVSKDIEIDQKVANEIKKIDAEVEQPPVASAPDKFRF